MKNVKLRDIANITMVQSPNGNTYNNNRQGRYNYNS